MFNSVSQKVYKRGTKRSHIISSQLAHNDNRSRLHHEANHRVPCDSVRFTSDPAGIQQNKVSLTLTV